MNTQINLGIWISKVEHLNIIDFVLSKYNNIDDVFVISDNNIGICSYAVIPSYYTRFEDIEVVFLEIQDWLENKDDIRSENISLFCSTKQILESGLCKNNLKNVKVFEL
jgi:hypothetical protein